MPRKCLCCAHPERKKLDEEITAGLSSARSIASRFRVSPNSVLNHRRHITGEIAASYSKHAGELEQILARVDRLIKLFEAHLKNKPRTALSLDWIRESRDWRGWLTFRAKALGKIAPAKDTPRREGDRFDIVFIDPNGGQARIPLGIYERLKLNEKERLSLEQSCNSPRAESVTDSMQKSSGSADDRAPEIVTIV
ncbi:MAG TPA: hypothetical protein VEG68_10405 [Terriglobales bacterium]|nr:hypothetical protein [Terriglobales bacterium]